jgi:hypothetical protein
MSAAVPGFPAINVYYSEHRPEESTGHVKVSVLYYGWPEDLIAAGIATAEMLGPKVKGRKRIDADGDAFSVSWYWRLKNGQPQYYYKLLRRKDAERLDTLPGARAAVTEYLRKNTTRPELHGGTREWQEYIREANKRAEASLRELTRATMPSALRQLIETAVRSKQ